MTHPTDSADATDLEPTTCACCGPIETDGGHAAGHRWLGDAADPLDVRLPDRMRTRLGRVLDDQPVETIGDWLAAIRDRVDGDAVTVDQLCHADGETAHVGRLDGETYHFRCFYDAVALSALVDDPVDIETESPGGHRIEARAVGTDALSVTPQSAVFSFGVATDAEPYTGGDPTPEAVYGAVCPYVRAFPDREAYEAWTDDVPATTVGLPLAGATEIAAALVE